jgi:hypothetical protein
MERRTVFLFLIVACYVIPNCLNALAFRSNLPNIIEIDPEIEKIGIINDPDDLGNHRQTEQEYANSHNRTFAAIDEMTRATGVIYCGGRNFMTADLVRKTGDLKTDKVIATAGHLFFDPDDCTPKVKDPKECIFIPKSNHTSFQTDAVKISKLVGTGLKCPASPGGQDFTILTLERHPQGITPYEVDKEPPELKRGRALVAVAATSFDFYKTDASGKKLYPKHIGDCHVKGESEYGIITNCERGKWASGGAIIDPSNLYEPPKLLALISADDETAEMTKRAVDSGVPNSGTFDMENWKAIEVPVTPEFIRILDKASELTSGDSPSR